jgi:hypothetical protein|uniref:Uncharacterized protein n=1 Tax=viral metagenome TaxID=1070528 RepID=A0A6C0J1Z5_9ZZZZ
MIISSLYFYPILAALIAFVFMYLDSRLFDNKKTKMTYIKNAALVGFIVWLLVFLLDIDGTQEIPIFDENISLVPEINERMIQGVPDF